MLSIRLRDVLFFNVMQESLITLLLYPGWMIGSYIAQLLQAVYISQRRSKATFSLLTYYHNGRDLQ